MNPNSYQPTFQQSHPNPFSNASNTGGRDQGGYRAASNPSSAGVLGGPSPGTSMAPPQSEASPAPESLGNPSPHEDRLAGTGSDASNRLALELKQFTTIASKLRQELVPAPNFSERCQQAFDVANDLFGNAPTWICFYRELMGGNGMLHMLFESNKDFGAFLRTDQHHQIQLMLTALRSRDLPENDPNDPQRMITVRLPKSLHEAMCEEAGRLNISVNRLCISRMLQLLDPEMIPETHSKPRGRKPRTRTKPASTSGLTAASSPTN